MTSFFTLRCIQQNAWDCDFSVPPPIPYIHTCDKVTIAHRSCSQFSCQTWEIEPNHQDIYWNILWGFSRQSLKEEEKSILFWENMAITHPSKLSPNKHEKSSRSLGLQWGGLCQVEVSSTILETEDSTRHRPAHRSVYRVCPRLKIGSQSSYFSGTLPLAGLLLL